MAAQILSGNAVASILRSDCKERVNVLKAIGVQPGLAVILVGGNPASEVYVRNKQKACAEVGMRSEVHAFTGSVPEEIVLQRIRELNAKPAIHGILVQLPLPESFDNEKIFETIAFEKDVDGFHMINLGGLVAGKPLFPPCTPHGVIRLLEHVHLPVEGKNAVVVGRSNIVGKPMALMLLQKSATVSVCTSKTRNLAEYTSRADILVVAAGKPNLITGSMVKESAVVVDVGINRLPDGRIVGDVDFESVSAKASYITPVPGGVGPMTIGMLIDNTVTAAERFARMASNKTRAHPPTL